MTITRARTIFCAFCLALAVPNMVLAGPPAAVRTAANLAATGKYAKALKILSAPSVRRHGSAMAASARIEVSLGRYSQARAILARIRGDNALREKARVLLADIDVRTGAYTKAKATLQTILRHHDRNLQAKLLLAQTLDMTGNRVAARSLYGDFFTDFDNGLLDKSDAKTWLLLAKAATGLRQWQTASDAFEKASKLNPKSADTWITWAKLAMSKYRVDWADEYLNKVLKLNPNHPDALADLAWLEWYAPRGRQKKGRAYAQRALKVNPSCVRALQYLASVEVFDANYSKASSYLRRGLAVNPNDVTSQAIQATVALLTEHKTRFHAIERRVLALNPHAARFYNVAARFLSRHHRYGKAAAFNKKAVALDPKDGDALADAGFNLLRVAQYSLGWFYLKESWKVDRYNYRTYNLLTLHDDIKKRFSWFTAGHFRFLTAKDEKNIIADYVPKIMNQAFEIYQKKYHFNPRTPVSVELYDKAADFQTRTFGEPAGAGIMGVCFGQVITALSPSVGQTNWAYVLWHELAHVFHIQMTGGRVPRWFTEGLAEYETMVAKAYWKREYARLLHRMRLAGTMPGVLTVNRRFTNSKSSLGVVLAYYQSSQMIAFIAKKWGFSKIVEALHAYARNATTKNVVEKVLHTNAAAFDRGFSAYLDRIYPVYRKQFDPLVFSVLEEKQIRQRIKAHPKDATAKAWLASRLIVSGDRKKAAQVTKLLADAAAIDPKNPDLLYARSIEARRAHRKQLERTLLGRLAASDHDGYEIQIRLAKLAIMAKQESQAIKHLKAARRFDPEASTPLQALALLDRKHHRMLKAARVLYDLAWIQQTSPSVTYTALKWLAHFKKWKLVRRLGPLAVHLQPFNPLLHEKYAWALRAGGAHRRALSEFDAALSVKPNNKKWVLMGKALSLAALHRITRAMAVVQSILDEHPNFMPAVTLKHKINPDADL